MNHSSYSTLLFIHDIAWKHEFWEVRISLDIWKKIGIIEAIFNTLIFTLGSIGFFGCSFNICCEFKREKILFWTCYTEALQRWLYGRTESVSTLTVPSDSLFTFVTGLRMKIPCITRCGWWRKNELMFSLWNVKNKSLNWLNPSGMFLFLIRCTT